MIRINHNMKQFNKQLYINIKKMPKYLDSVSEELMNELLRSMRARSRAFSSGNQDSVSKNFGPVEKISKGKETMWRIKNRSPHALLLITGVEAHPVMNPNVKGFDEAKSGKSTYDNQKLAKWFKDNKIKARWITVGGPNSFIEKGNSQRDFYNPAIEKVFDTNRVKGKYINKINKLFGGK